MHILLFGASLKAISLDSCRDLNDIRRTISDAAKDRPHEKRLFCQGWMHFQTGSLALASMIDDLDPRPIFVQSKDLHSAWLNTAALKELDIEDAPDPAGGEILRDANGHPSGLLSEAASIQYVWSHMAKVTSQDEKLDLIREAVRAHNAAGYTGIIEMATDEEIWSLLKQLKDSEGLSIRLAAHWLIRPCKTEAEHLSQVDTAIALHKQYNLTTSPDFRIAGIKIIGDGVVDACTASLREPYSSNNTNCDPIWTRAMLEPVVKRADRAGLQCAIHAIGDNTVQLAVSVLESTATPGRRHRIEHLELTRPEDARRLGELGITASVQPVHADPAIFTEWPRLIGPDRCARAFAYKDFLDHGATLAIGTDTPTAPHHPLQNLYIATTRRSARRPHLPDPINPHFKLSLTQALTAATTGAAYSCFAEKRVGTLEQGKLADFVVVDNLRVAEDLLDGFVSETWFAGKCVFQKSRE